LSYDKTRDLYYLETYATEPLQLLGASVGSANLELEIDFSCELYLGFRIDWFTLVSIALLMTMSKITL